MLNKPEGYICTARKNSKTKIVLDLFEGIEERLFTVGRLDKDTKGLLIVTNDGHFAHKAIHPSSNITKEYLAKTDSEITAEHLKAISSGTLVEGIFIKPKNCHQSTKRNRKNFCSRGQKTRSTSPATKCWTRSTRTFKDSDWGSASGRITRRFLSSPN